MLGLHRDLLAINSINLKGPHFFMEDTFVLFNFERNQRDFWTQVMIGISDFYWKITLSMFLFRTSDNQARGSS